MRFPSVLDRSAFFVRSFRALGTSARSADPIQYRARILVTGVYAAALDGDTARVFRSTDSAGTWQLLNP